MERLTSRMSSIGDLIADENDGSGADAAKGAKGEEGEEGAGGYRGRETTLRTLSRSPRLCERTTPVYT